LDSPTGGETSEQPGVLNEGVYILTSSIAGIADRNKIIDGSKIKENDAVINLESSGLHTNGYSLIRKIIENKPEIINQNVDGRKFLEVILEPHRCYYKALKELFESDIIKGMAHITGGGIRENLNRILPGYLNAEIDLSRYNMLPIFRFLKDYAGLEDDDMIRTFNMGVGIALVSDKKHKDKIINHLRKFNINSYEIGKIINGNKEVILKNKIIW